MSQHDENIQDLKHARELIQNVLERTPSGNLEYPDEYIALDELQKQFLTSIIWALETRHQDKFDDYPPLVEHHVSVLCDLAEGRGTTESEGPVYGRGKDSRPSERPIVDNSERPPAR